VRALVALGANQDAETNTGFTPVQIAAPKCQLLLMNMEDISSDEGGFPTCEYSLYGPGAGEASGETPGQASVVVHDDGNASGGLQEVEETQEQGDDAVVQTAGASSSQEEPLKEV